MKYGPKVITLKPYSNQCNRKPLPCHDGKRKKKKKQGAQLHRRDDNCL
jgi:hypothetical protein